MSQYVWNIPESKQKHMFAVAEHLGKHSEEYGLDTDKMYLLGLVHDIGYIYGRENHEKNGAMLLRSCGMDERLAYAVEHHGDNLKKLEKKHGFLPTELILLVAADMTYGSEGKNLGFNGRLEELRERYDDIQTAEENVAYLNDYFDKYSLDEDSDK